MASLIFSFLAHLPLPLLQRIGFLAGWLTYAVAHAGAKPLPDPTDAAVMADQFDSLPRLSAQTGLAYALGLHPLYVDRADEADLDPLRDRDRRA